MVGKPKFRLQGRGAERKGKTTSGQMCVFGFGSYWDSDYLPREGKHTTCAKELFFFSTVSAMEILICHFYMNDLAYIALIPMCGIKPKMEDTQQYDKKLTSNTES